jgi:two-component system, response regulator PdtaR
LRQSAIKLIYVKGMVTVRAIIVEDEFLAAMHAEAALESLGVDVIGTAEDSAGAIKLAAAAPHMALIDLNLRDGFTGPTIAAQLLQDGIHVVFLTANPRQLEECGFAETPVLEKPLDEAVLAQAIQFVMARVAG